MNVFEYFHMHITGEKFFFEPRQPDGGQINGEKSCLVIDRVSNDISVQPRSVLPNYAEIKKIFGIFGIIRLITGPHVIVITQRNLVGLINGEYIYRVGATEIIPYALSVQHFNEAELRENQAYHLMVRNVLDMDSYYFSPTYDLTHTLQRLQNTDPQFLQLSMQERADPRWVWNGYMLRDLAVVPDTQRYAMPIMLGFVLIRTCRVAGKTFQLTLVSRRSCFRAGVRFQTRGLDVEGHSANSVETEQIVEYGDAFTSFVQTRGSIPVYWNQKPNFRWLPKPKIRPDEDHVKGFKLHVQNQLFHYERLCLISLINNRGSEKVMADALEYLCKNAGIANVHLVAFDFHYHCKNMNWTKLYQFVKDLKEWIDGFGFFCARRSDNEIRQVKRQTGVFRVNCMDCLDRTNVVQSLLSKSSLENQLRYLQILTENDSLDRYVEFDADYKNIWADNGDCLSVQYAGTGALKADFTRFGRRTYGGALNDGRNASSRWVINNFYDGFRQDSIDFFLGNYAIDEGNPLKQRMNEWEFRHYLYAAVAIAMAMLILCFIVSTEYTVHFGLIWFVVCFALIGYIVMNGEQLVNRPKFKLE